MVTTREQAALSKLARGGVLNFAGSVLNGTIAFALVLLVTKGFDIGIGGVIIQSVAVFNIVVVGSTLGAGIALVQQITLAQEQGKDRNIPLLAVTALLGSLIASLIVAVTLLLASGSIASFLAQPEAADLLAQNLRTMAPFVPFGVLSLTALGGTEAFADMKPTVLVERLLRPGAQLLLFTTAVALGVSMRLAIYAWMAPYVLSGVAAIWFMTRRIALARAREVPLKERSEVVRRYWRFAVPCAFTRLLQVSLRWLDVVLVAALLGASEALIYAAATRLLLAGQFFSQSVVQISRPLIASAFSAGRPGEARTVYSTATGWLSLAMWPVYVVLALVSGPILIFLDASYADAAVALSILALAMLLSAGVGPAEVMLVMSGRQGQFLTNNVLALGLNVTLNILLIPVLGLEGAAVAWVAALMATNALPAFQVWRRTGIHPFSFAQLKVGLGVVVLVAAPLGLARLVGVDSLAPLLLIAVAGGVLLLAFTWRERDALHLETLLSGVRGGGSRSRRDVA